MKIHAVCFISCVLSNGRTFTHTSKALSQQNQTHLKYFETKSNKNLCKWDGGGEKGWGGQAVEGGGRSSLWEPCTGAGGRRWRWIRWPPRGESPPCLWWMGRLRSSAGARRCRQTRKLMLKSGNEKNKKNKGGVKRRANNGQKASVLVDKWWIRWALYKREALYMLPTHAILTIVTSKLAFSPEHRCADVTCQMNVS